MKILITGQNSYIGTSFETWAKQQNPDWIIDTIDVRGDEWKKKSFSEYDAVINVAGIAHVKAKNIDSKLYYKVNTDLPIAIALKAKTEKIKHFIQFSSMSVYGMDGSIGKEVVLSKKSRCNPKTDYGKSKMLADQELEKIGDSTFLVSILRPPMVYGKGCLGNYVVLSNTIKKIRFFPGISNKRSMIYIDNLSQILVQTLESKNGGILHPQNRDYVSTYEMVLQIAQSNNIKVFKIRGLKYLLSLFSHLLPILNKIFGNLTYDLSDSDFVSGKEIGLYDSIQFIESSCLRNDGDKTNG